MGAIPEGDRFGEFGGEGVDNAERDITSKYVDSMYLWDKLELFNGYESSPK